MISLLIVDDKKDILEMIEKHLVRSGHSVMTAQNAARALDILNEQKIDILITDLKMPGMDGQSLLQKARAAHPELQVIIMTAYGTVEDAVVAVKAGAFDFIQKPFPMEELEVRLQRCAQMTELRGENRRLKDELSLFQGKMVGNSSAMQGVYDTIRKVSGTKTTVLLQGESGTGKELVAQAIHENSPWKKGPFISVHCAALTPTLLESELFGHEKGSFTGALQRKIGRFELANGGTLFLDEISEVPLETQVKLLRVLQERQFERVGGTQSIQVDLRIIAASNRNLAQKVTQGAFREDLYYRLNVVELFLPPLRERLDDIPLLTDSFLERICRQLGKPLKRLSSASTQVLRSYPWPGNVRELQNLLERAVVLSEGEELDIPAFDKKNTLSTPGGLKGDLIRTLEEVERALLLQALGEVNGVQSQAARKLGVSRSALQYKIAKYQLESYCRENP